MPQPLRQPWAAWGTPWTVLSSRWPLVASQGQSGYMADGCLTSRSVLVQEEILLEWWEAKARTDCPVFHALSQNSLSPWLPPRMAAEEPIRASTLSLRTMSKHSAQTQWHVPLVNLPTAFELHASNLLDPPRSMADKWILNLFPVQWASIAIKRTH